MKKTARHRAIDPAALHRILRLERESGRLFWKVRPRDLCPSDRAMNTFNAQCAGNEACASVSRKYKTGSLFNIRGIKAHQIIFAMEHGRWPSAIDHDDGDTLNNRPGNLIERPQSENNKNRALRHDNKTGYSGVEVAVAPGRYTAAICVDSERQHLGTFKCITAAAVARKRAEFENNYHPNHGRMAETPRRSAQ